MLRVVVDRVVRSILQVKREEVTGEWNKSHNEDFHSFLSSLSTMAIK